MFVAFMQRVSVERDGHEVEKVKVTTFGDALKSQKTWQGLRLGR